MTSDPQWLTIAEAEVIAGVSRRTIYKWLETNKILYIRTASGRVRIVGSSLFRTGNIDPPLKENP